MSATRGVPAPATDAKVTDWLLEGDPSIRWQSLRDLVGAAPRTVARERARIAREGWGARLLSRQDPDGRWAGGQSSDGGLYSPKWISTTYTMLTLRDLGLPPDSPSAHRACRLLLDGGLQRDGGINYGWRGRSETCITGMVLSIVCYFGYEDDRLDVLARHLLGEQMPDGGWNCRRDHGARHSSVHTTISVLGCSARTEPEPSSIRSSSASRSLRAGTTTSCGRSTTSSPWTRRATTASATRSTSCASIAAGTDDGRWSIGTAARRTSSSSRSAGRAGGTRCGRCAC
jgi:hypothetical protein